MFNAQYVELFDKIGQTRLKENVAIVMYAQSATNNSLLCTVQIHLKAFSALKGILGTNSQKKIMDTVIHAEPLKVFWCVII